MLISAKPFCQSVGKSKLQESRKKRSCIKKKAKYSSFIKIEALDKIKIKTAGFHNHFVQKYRIDLDKASSKNSSQKEINPAHKFAKLESKTNRKVYECKTYNKTIINLVHRNKVPEAIEK